MSLLYYLMCYIGCCCSWYLMSSTPLSAAADVGSSQKNVLLLIADDLRPEIGAYYESAPTTASDDQQTRSPPYRYIHTPSLNSLAAQSLVLRKAYVQQAICAPSRLSMLTSRRPDTTLIYTIEDTYWRHVAGNLTTLPQYFKLHGYRSIGIGKVFHHGSGSDQDDPPSWTEEFYRVPRQVKDHWHNRDYSWRAVSPPDRHAVPLPDDLVADRAVQTLHQLANSSKRQPFFMAVGFYKPHLPFVFPSQYQSLYPLDRVNVPNPIPALVDVPSLARTGWEINKYGDIRSMLNLTSDSDDADDDAFAMSARDDHPEMTSSIHLDDDVIRQLRRAYYCTVSYVDDLVGRILAELNASPEMAANTVVAFIGDHGLHLGESNLWGKHTNFDLATRAPFILRVPDLTDAGLIYERPVEMVDLFPTVVEAAGFPPLPVCPADPDRSWRITLCTEGASLMPLVTRKSRPSPSRPITPLVKQVAFSQYPRRGFSVMGYSIRTDRYRYTEWARRPSTGKNGIPSRWRVVHAVELYDHATDPDEVVNVADSPLYHIQRAELEAQLAGGWRAAMFVNESVVVAGPRSNHAASAAAFRGTARQERRRTSVEKVTYRTVPMLRLVTLRPPRNSRTSTSNSALNYSSSLNFTTTSASATRSGTKG